MGSKLSPQLLKEKVIGARFTPSQQAQIEIVRGSRAAGTWLHDVAVAALAKEIRQLEDDGDK